MVMQSLRQGASGGFLKFILLGLMTMAVAGLVVMDIGGFFRGGGVGNNDVMKVGGESVSIMHFDRKLRRAAAGANISTQQAYQMGMADQLLTAEVQSRVMTKAAEEYGLSVSRETIAKEISRMVLPMVPPGENPKDVLNQILRSQGISEQELIEDMRAQTLNNILVAALQSGFAAVNEDIVRDLALSQKETRDIEYIFFPRSDVKIDEPDEEQIAALYEMRKQVFAEPELRTFTLIRLKDDALTKDIAISEEDISDAYERNIDYYSMEANIVFEQAILPSEDEAGKIAAAAQNTSLKKAVQSAAGNLNDYLGENNTVETKLLPEVKDAIIAAKDAGEVLEPLESPLGWHVVKIVKINPAATKPLEDVRKDIELDLKENALADARYAAVGTVEDMLAAGASLDEVGKEVALDIKSLPPVNSAGIDEKGKNPFAEFGESGKSILESGFALEQGAASSMIELPDGGFIGLYLEDIKPESHIPLASVRDALKKDLIESQRALQNRAKAQEVLDAIKDGKSLQQVAAAQKKKLVKVNGLTRRGDHKPLNESGVMQIFEAEENAPFVINLEGGVGIAVVKNIFIPESFNLSSSNYGQFINNVQASLRNEALMMFLAQKQEQYNVRFNQHILERAYGGAGQSE